ncbi:hypothetical protein [Microcoleus sp. PH2017_30_WIL_O_A]|uniref:hypothetical protein n=1 Tax=Microcoleus sp. PH2017_30_WIL_O_A TaxID=2798840 RepID=UPI001D8C3BFA|nr:hypothetical protein [Microcoleus sp. PH2017_30_WIL_O_A]MCC3586675.1 hypothetical protein [Microcoleus sp. PH2017_30_WIL_O_A]
MIDTEEAKTLLGGPKQELPHNPQTPEEILVAMKAASANYYREAIATNCHTFIEFIGLINEYIKICERTQTSAHHTGGPRLHVEQWECDYINDKLRCIFPNLRMVKLDDLKKLEHSEKTATDK